MMDNVPGLRLFGRWYKKRWPSAPVPAISKETLKGFIYHQGMIWAKSFG